MIKSFITGFCEGFCESLTKPSPKSNTRHSYEYEYTPPPPRPAPKYVPPEDFVVEKCPSVDTKPVQNTQEQKPKKSKKKQEPEETLPPNVKAFTLPDGSVVYINTEHTEMSEESVIDSIMNTK